MKNIRNLRKIKKFLSAAGYWKDIDVNKLKSEIYKSRYDKLKNRNNILKKTFGSLKIKKPTQQIMDEIDENYD